MNQQELKQTLTEIVMEEGFYDSTTAGAYGKGHSAESFARTIIEQLDARGIYFCEYEPGRPGMVYVNDNHLRIITADS